MFPRTLIHRISPSLTRGRCSFVSESVPKGLSGIRLVRHDLTIQRYTLQRTASFFSGKASIRSPYEILGVSRTASAKEIKMGFYREAKKHHPDMHPNDPSGRHLKRHT